MVNSMKIKAIRPFWVGEKSVQPGETLDVKDALAAELIAYAKAAEAPTEAASKSVKAPPASAAE